MKTTRREFAAAVGAAPAMPGSRRPNVLLILADQWSGLLTDDPGGHPQLRTPAVRALASGGARFASSYCTYPLCSPSRASLVTGRMPRQAGVASNVRPDSHPVPAAVPTLGEVFSAAGYETGYFGKEHIGGAGYRGFRSLGSVRYARGGYLADGSTLDPVFTRDAIQFIRERRSHPFLGVVSLINPHDICYQPPHANLPVTSMAEISTAFEWGRAKYLRGQELPGVRPNFHALPPASIARVGQIQSGWTEMQWRLYLAAYYLLVENTDWLIGLLLETLRAAGLEKDTLVLFTADHGDQMGAHQLVGKGVFYEEAARVPFVLSWPGVVKPGRVESRALISGVDLLPTLCDFAGLRPPAGMAGVSVRPLLERQGAPWRERLAAETQDGRMLRYGPYKYITYRRPGNPELLFNLAHDPGETRDVAASEPAALEQGRKLMEEVS